MMAPYVPGTSVSSCSGVSAAHSSIRRSVAQRLCAKASPRNEPVIISIPSARLVGPMKLGIHDKSGQQSAAMVPQMTGPTMRGLPMTTTEPMTPREFEEADGAEDWRVLGEGACIYFRTATFAESARLVQAIAAVAGVEDHAPNVDVRDGGVTVQLLTITDEYAGMTTGDLEVARQISAAARNLGLDADPSAVQSFLVIPGAPDVGEVTPFWQALLGYEPRADSPDEDLVDPRDRG